MRNYRSLLVLSFIHLLFLGDIFTTL